MPSSVVTSGTTVVVIRSGSTAVSDMKLSMVVVVEIVEVSVSFSSVKLLLEVVVEVEVRFSMPVFKVLDSVAVVVSNVVVEVEDSVLLIVEVSSGHSCIWHLLISVDLPSQGCPSPSTSCSMDLLRAWTPGPQE